MLYLSYPRLDRYITLCTNLTLDISLTYSTYSIINIFIILLRVLMQERDEKYSQTYGDKFKAPVWKANIERTNDAW